MIEYFADRIKSADEEYRYRLDFKIQAETDEKKFQALQAYKNFISNNDYLFKNLKQVCTARFNTKVPLYAKEYEEKIISILCELSKQMDNLKVEMGSYYDEIMQECGLYCPSLLDIVSSNDFKNSPIPTLQSRIDSKDKMYSEFEKAAKLTNTDITKEPTIDKQVDFNKLDGMEVKHRLVFISRLPNDVQQSYDSEYRSLAARANDLRRENRHSVSDNSKPSASSTTTDVTTTPSDVDYDTNTSDYHQENNEDEHKTNDNNNIKVKADYSQLLKDYYNSVKDKSVEEITNELIELDNSKSYQNLYDRSNGVSVHDKYQILMSIVYDKNRSKANGNVQGQITGTTLSDNKKQTIDYSKLRTKEDYHITQEAYDDYIAEGYEPGTEDFYRAAINDGANTINYPNNNTESIPLIEDKQSETPRLTSSGEPLQITEPTEVKQIPELPPASEIPLLTGPIEQKKETPLLLGPVVPKTDQEHVLRTSTIVANLCEGLEFGAKDGKYYSASNIKVMANTRDYITKVDNGWYKAVAVTPAIVKMPGLAVMKAIGNARLSDEARANIEELDRRLTEMESNFDDPRWATLAEGNDYSANFSYYSNMLRYPEIVTTLFAAHIKNYYRYKVDKNNEKITELYDKLDAIQAKIDALNSKRNDSNSSLIDSAISSLVAGTSADIQEILHLQTENEKMLNGAGGILDVNENVKASNTRMSLKGARFSKAKGSNENQQLFGEYDAQIQAAIIDGKELDAFNKFMERDKVLTKESKVTRSFWGKVQNGDANYSRTSVARDFRDDPFLKDLATTATTIGSAAAIVSSFQKMVERNNAINADNKAIDNISDQNRKIGQDVNAQGQHIQDDARAVAAGQQAQSKVTQVGMGGFNSRAGYDNNKYGGQGGWFEDPSRVDSVKEGFDSITKDGQKVIESMATTQNALKSQLGNPNLSAKELLELSNQNLKDISSEFQQFAKEYQPILEWYSTHAGQKFDLVIQKDLIDQALKNEEILKEFASSTMKVEDIGEKLLQISPSLVSGLNATPLSLRPTLLASLSLYVLGIAQNKSVATHAESAVKDEENKEKEQQQKEDAEKFADDILANPEKVEQMAKEAEKVSNARGQNVDKQEVNSAVINKLMDGLTFGAKDGKHYSGANIKVGRNFIGRIVANNNIWYKIAATTPAFMGILPSAVVKGLSNMKLTQNARDNITKLQENLDKLTDEEIEALAFGTNQSNTFSYYANVYRYQVLLFN